VAVLKGNSLAINLIALAS